MDRKNNDENLIRAYLLGELSEIEQAQLEQRLMTDDECFHLATAMEEELVDQYLYGQLSKAEQEKFSRRFLATPEGAEQLRLAATLKKYVRRERLDKQMGVRRQLSASDATPRRSAGFAWLGLQSAAARYALVAAAIFLGAILVLGGRVWRLQSQVEQLRASQGSPTSREQELQNQLAEQRSRNDDLATSLQQTQAERARLELEVQRLNSPGNDHSQTLVASLTLPPGRPRSVGNNNLLVIKPGMSQVRLHLLVREPAYTTYQASLQTASGKPVWTAESLTPQLAGGRIHLRISLPAQFLSGGDFQLRLQGRTGSGDYEEAGNYYFRVAKE